MHNCSNLCCYSQVMGCQVAHYLQRALISRGTASSSALVQWKIKPASKQHVVCICDSVWHFVTVFIILQINKFDGGPCMRGKVNLISCVCEGLKKSIWGKAHICAIVALKVLGRSLGRGGWWQQLWLCKSLAVIRCKDWKPVFVHDFYVVCSPMTLAFACSGHSWYFSGNWN